MNEEIKMGVYYYVVIPKLKIMLWLGRNIQEDNLDEENEKIKNIFDLWYNYHYEDDSAWLSEIKNRKIKDITLADCMALTFYLSKIENLLVLQNHPATTMKYLVAKSIDQNSYVISDCPEEMEKLGKKYKIIDEDIN